MSGLRSTEVLAQWREEANAAVLPAEPPSPTRGGYPIGVVGTIVAVVVLLAALLARGYAPHSGEPTDASVGSEPSASARARAPAILPTSVPSISPPATGSPAASTGPSSFGQACSAKQLVLGKVTVAPGYGTLGTDSLFVTQPVRNAGGDCVFHVPRTIGVASAAGQLHVVASDNAGTATEFNISSGASVSVLLGAWWWVPGRLSGTGMSAPPCAGAISDVSRVSIQLGSDSLEVDLGTVWREVCTSPATVSITVRG
jgi:hypothetical protein